MLMPKKVKYRKPHSTSFKGLTKGNKYVAFGEYGLQATEGGWITNRQIESARVVASKSVKKCGKLWIRIFPHLATTKKPIEVRMGSGKGAPDGWVAVVKEGCIMFEIQGLKEDASQKVLIAMGHKLPIKTKIVKKTSEILLSHEQN